MASGVASGLQSPDVTLHPTMTWPSAFAIERTRQTADLVEEFESGLRQAPPVTESVQEGVRQRPSKRRRASEKHDVNGGDELAARGGTRSDPPSLTRARTRRSVGEQAIKVMLAGAAVLSVLTTAGIVITLITESSKTTLVTSPSLTSSPRSTKSCRADRGMSVLTMSRVADASSW